jgi:YD repeat-containing protein
VTSYEYDSLGRLIQTGYTPVNGVATTSSETYDSAGNKASETDQLGRVTSYKYDDAGDLVEVDQPAVPNPSNTAQMVTPVTKYTFDNFGDELTQTDANSNVTKYTYDENGNMLTETLPNGESESWTYDQFGRALTHVDFDHNATGYTYDTSTAHGGRETGEYFFSPNVTFQNNSGQIITTSASQSTLYTYTALGQPYVVTDDSGATTYTYDADGNILEENTPEGIIQYGYNALDQHIATWTDTTGASNTGEMLESYSYDDLGRLSGMTVSRLNGANTSSALNTVYGYDGNGNKVYESDPNGDVTNYTYDALNRLTAETVKNDGTTLYSVAYTLNLDGTRHSATENNDGTSIVTTWTYDNDDRLTSEVQTSGGNYTDTYTYDLDGNRLTKSHTVSGSGAETTTYTYNSDNELTQQVDSVTGTINYAYDANGSQTNNGTNIYVYDLRNKLTKIENEAGTTVLTTYVYDDAGNRVQETTGGTTTYYLTDANNPTGYAEPIEAWTVTAGGSRSSAMIAMTYLIGDRVIGQANSSSNVSYLVVDGVDNTRLLVNSSGSATATFNYDAFGDPVGSWSLTSASTVILFQQTMFDAASGLNIAGDGGREERIGSDDFIERDPPGYSSNENPITLDSYLLDGADSINMIDPTGHDGLLDTSLAVGGAAGLQAIGLPAVAAVETAATATVEAANFAGSAALLLARGLTYTAALYGAVTALYDAAQASRTMIEQAVDQAIWDAIVTDAKLNVVMTQAVFTDLDNLTEEKLGRHLYLHYSFESQAVSLTVGMRPGSYVTTDIYPTGWDAHNYLSLPSTNIQDAEYIVLPNSGFDPTYIGEVKAAQDDAGRLLEGGGDEYILPKGSGGAGTVFGPVLLPPGNVPE